MFSNYISLVHQNATLCGKGLNVNQKLKFALGRVEKIAGKEEEWLPAFLLFLQCF